MNAINVFCNDINNNQRRIVIYTTSYESRTFLHEFAD
jgi:hypothetical protein